MVSHDFKKDVLGNYFKDQGFLNFEIPRHIVRKAKVKKHVNFVVNINGINVKVKYKDLLSQLS